MYLLLVRTMALAALAALPVSAQLRGIKTVFIIVMENHNWSDFKDAPNAPYINGTLLPQASHAEGYNNPPGNHPSLPNYLWLEAGANFGIYDDNEPAINHQSTTSHLVTQLNNAGISWKTYQEDISGNNCPLSGVNAYAPKHNPFIYFDDVTNGNNPNSAYCIAHVRPFYELGQDLQSNNVARYVFITPNLCDDGHDACAPQYDAVAQSDNWLAANVPSILNSTAYQNGGALFITWDEGEGSDGPIGLIALSPLAKGAGYSSANYYTHGSLLRTVEEIFGVGALRDAAAQNDLSDLFGAAILKQGPPEAPQNLTASAGDSQVALNWNASTGANSYNLKRGYNSGGPYTGITSINSTSYVDTGIGNGSTVYYIVTAVNLSGESGNSPEANATPNVLPPASPSNLNATAGDSQITVTWNAAQGASSFNLKRGIYSGGYDSLVASGITTTSFTDTTVANGTTYYYVVTSVNTSGESGNSNEANATPGSTGLTPILLINVGGDYAGSYVSDNGFSGGRTGATSANIDLSNAANPAPQAVYQTWRTGSRRSPNFSYVLTGLNADTNYTLRLHFAENSVSSPGQRIFDVLLNGNKVLDRFDIVSAAGGEHTAVIETFNVTADENGQISLTFSAVTANNPPVVNGIEVDQ